MDNEFAILSREEAVMGSSLAGYIFGVTYNQLVEAFGPPAFNPEDSGDGKVNFEWVFKFNGEVFTLYDWKTYDVDYTTNLLTRWNVGSKIHADKFINYIQSIIEKP